MSEFSGRASARRPQPESGHAPASADVDPTKVTPVSELREETAEWILKSRKKAREGHLHLPHPESTDDQPLPLCAEGAKRIDPDSWMSKPTAVYPPDHRPMCKRCRAQHDFGRELGADWSVYDEPEDGDD